MPRRVAPSTSSSELNELRKGHKYSLTVAAGDLIGGSPAFSGLFHDEPSVESLNAMGLDISGVGNHEFDEGVTELLRMQNGGCHPVDGCYFPDEPYAGRRLPVARRQRGRARRPATTPLPPYEIRTVKGVKVAFIGMTLEAHRRTGRRVRYPGLRLPRRGRDRQRPRARDCSGQGVEAIVVLLHEGGVAEPPPGDVDACVGISGPIVAINAALTPRSTR